MRTQLLFLAASFMCLNAGDWPQWRGPQRDGHAASDEKLSVKAIASPKPVWKLKIGGGFSSPIVSKNRLIYCDEQNGSEVAHCVDAATGTEIWQVPYAAVFEDEWGAGPRSTPFTDGERVYVQSCNGEFRCLNIADGSKVWGFSFEKDYGVHFLGSKAQEGTATRRGNNGSGILEGETVIVPVGAADGATLVCLNKRDGKVIWKCGDDEAAYSSLAVGDLAGARQVLALSAEALFGTDVKSGKILWRVPLKTNAKRHAMTPVVSGNSLIVNSHTFGMICFEISQKDGAFQATEKWKNPAMKINLATPVIENGTLYSHGPTRNMVAIDLQTGNERWAHDGFGKDYSSTLAIGGFLFILTDLGEAVIIRPNLEKYEEVARVQMVGKNWNHPAVANGCLYVRDQKELASYRLQ